MVGEAVCYLDASALVKLVIPEPQTGPLRAYLHSHPRRVTSRLSTVEVPRAVARRGRAGQEGAVQERAVAILSGLSLIDLDYGLAQAAALLEPASLRTLDAIHLATALRLRPDLAAVVTYDRRLAEAAEAAGLPVVAPS